MAKTFSTVVGVAKETIYASELTLAPMLSASLNTNYRFTPLQKSNGTTGSPTTSAQYQIQRAKRIKAQEVANPNTGATSDALAILDSFSKVDWESILVATSKMRSIGIKISPNDKFDIDNVGEAQEREIVAMTKVNIIERKERFLEEIITNATDGGAIAPWEAGKTPLLDAITKVANIIELKGDDFKYMTSPSNIIIWLHPSLKPQAYKEIGQSFNQEAPIYKTGLKSRFSIAGYPVIVDPQLNVFDADEGKRLGAVVMDIEAMAFNTDDLVIPIDNKIAITRYIGQAYYGIEKLIDTSRTYKLNFTPDAAIVKTAKVSA